MCLGQWERGKDMESTLALCILEGLQDEKCVCIKRTCGIVAATILTRKYQ